VGLGTILGERTFDCTFEGTFDRGAAPDNVVVLHAENRRFGLVVDDIHETLEIVVKPLCRYLGHIDVFAGTTILGDGSVALVLDAAGIARSSGVVSSIYGVLDGTEVARDDRRAETTTVLVCQVGDENVAVPVALVARLEEFPAASIGRDAAQDVLECRGGPLELHDLHELVSGAPSRAVAGDVTRQVVVYESTTRSFGLLVDDVVGVFEADLADGEAKTSTGIPLAGVAGRRDTDWLNLEQAIDSRRPQLSFVGDRPVPD
jgi:two-component system, chemotaxis family, sensor kinase CheA